MNHLRKRCFTVAVALMVPAIMSGCSSSNNQGSTSTSTTGGISSQVNAPTGTVMGVVQDTNGNPISGATVYLGGATATTNTGGQYTFTNVVVTNTANLNGINQQSLIVSIVPPTGYLGAYVTVTPAAQIDGISTDVYGTSNPVTTFISGYTAQAGTAVLPKLQATITGVLRDSNTGALLANTTIGLDFTDVLGAGGPSAQNGVATTYSTQPFTATSDAQGVFSIANVPNDSTLNVVTSGFTVTPAVSVNTAAGALGVNLGDVTMNPVTSADNVKPTFTTVTELANTNMLKSGTDGTTGITLQFSEAIQAKASYVVQVFNVDTGALLASNTTLAADGKSATVTTTAAIPAGTNVDINLLTADFHDLAGNPITSDVAVPVGNTVVTATSGAQYLRLTLKSWKDALVGATAVTASAQGKTDNSGTNDLAALQALNPAFNDVWDGDMLASDFQGLNSVAKTIAVNDAQKRLSALAKAIQGKAVSVVSDQALFSFTPSNAASYVISVTNGLTVDVISGNATKGAVKAGFKAGFASNVLNVTDALPVSLIIGKAKPGDAVTITPVDDLGYNGTAVTTVLADNVEPTTVLQQSYGLATAQPAAVVPFGQGGQLASANASLVGTPYLTLTAGLLDNQKPKGNSLVEELFALNGNDANGKVAIAAPANPNIYDGTAYTAMNTKRTVGISMSENIALITATMPTFVGGQALTAWTANNDVLVNDNGLAVNEDLVNFNVADIFAMANLDHGKVIDLSNAIQDTATTPNVGTVAKVMVQDKLPPMVMSAFYNGSDITINFNEAINPAVGDIVRIGATAITLSQATIDTFNTSGINNKLVIGAANWGNNLGLLATFALPTYGNADHATLDFSNIQDVQGNAWGLSSAGITTPKFALATGVGVSKTFSVTTPVVATGFAAAVGAVSTTFSVAYVFSHPINLTTVFGAASPTKLTAAEVGAKFTLTSAALINTLVPATSASLSVDGKTLTVNVSTTAGVATGDTLTLTNPGLLGAFTSTYDNLQKVPFTTAALTVTAL